MEHLSFDRIDTLLTVNDLAELYEVSTRTIWRWSDLGIIPGPYKIRRSTRWKASEIQQHLSSLKPIAG